MENTLSNILNEPEEPPCQNDKFLVGNCCVREWQPGRRDIHTYIISLKEDPTASYYAVFDPHGGDTVAQYAAKHLHEIIVQQTEYTTGNDIEKALRESFLDIDNEILQNESGGGDPFVGSTAVVVLIKEDKLYCGNVGNSRAIASVGGQVKLLSVEHKPTAEKPRLYRILGDFELKLAHEKPVDELFTAYPDVESFQLTENWEFVILACDGVWGAMEQADVLKFCRHRIGQGMQPKKICDELMQYCLTHDDITHLTGDLTIILVCLLNGKPYSNLITRCQTAVEPVSGPVSDPESQ
ncbi:probable protein phosphatase 2C T23F11.1 [Drosophila innubila]|uniref:probable protein phosphatase 2C T23F11.1 n=1 Tax=Drosophila innubila TaxID=198719 RepID=UPI00148DE5E0|nr:probable protein phosphatase 2C T23F11.1 [Drosophila innubila]